MVRHRPSSVTTAAVLVMLVGIGTIAGGVVSLISSGQEDFLEGSRLTSGQVTAVGIADLSLGALIAILAAALSRGSRHARWFVSMILLLRILTVGYAWTATPTATAIIAVAASLMAFFALALLWGERASGYFAAR